MVSGKKHNRPNYVRRQANRKEIYDFTIRLLRLMRAAPDGVSYEDAATIITGNPPSQDGREVFLSICEQLEDLGIIRAGENPDTFRLIITP